jgi:type IV pilus assembly protein PilY1
MALPLHIRNIDNLFEIDQRLPIMNIISPRHVVFATALLVFVSGSLTLPVSAVATSISDSSQQAGAYALAPPLGVAGAAPLVMLNISRDHALFFKAFNDYSDLDGNGKLDTTYQNAIAYAGYFDPDKCYAYSSSGYFSPVSLTADHYCANQFSGNFMNWVSMTRMDEVRKILYGGKRSVDTASQTILERAYLPPDAHSFAKYYGGSDIAKLLPSTYAGVTTNPTGTANQAQNGDVDTNFNENSKTYTLWTLKGLSAAVPVYAGDQVQLTDVSGGSAPFTVVTGVRRFSGGNPQLRLQFAQFSNNGCTNLGSCVTAMKSVAKWNVVNLSRAGVTFCNTTVQGGSDAASQNNTSSPLLRVASGNYSLWGANEKKQCLWSTEKNNSQGGFDDGFLSNGNRAALSGLAASAENPYGKSDGTSDVSATLIARVEVCVSGLMGNETCRQYPDNKTPSNPYKPTGLLQKYGESGDIKFGLVTPTFDKNVSGGVLRAALPGPGSNSGDFISNEIDPTSGQRVAGSKGIISNLDSLRIYGFRYDNDDSYQPDDGCPYQQTGIGLAGSGTVVAQGNCSSWGNPMAESYVEALRYLAGKSPNAAFAQKTSGSKDGTLGLTLVTNWNDPVSEANYCAALNVININASAISYDTDQLGGFSDLNTGKTAVDWTNLVGSAEGIAGKAWFVGNPSSSYFASDANLCSAKVIANFGDAVGVCPEVPALKGGYDIAGAAYGAHVNRIRNLGNDSSGNAIVPTDDKSSLKVTTFGVQLSTNTPQIRVAVPGAIGKFITIIPAYRLTLPNGGGVGGGELVDFKVLSQTDDATTARGTFYANWEDSFAGGDYDQDMWGTITYEVTANSVKVTTKPVSASTNNGQGFGYIINGTTQDGPHFHSGIYSFSYNDPTNIDIYNAAGTRINGTATVNSSGGCNSCTVSDAATTAKYAVGTTSAGILQDPLLYAAKWGGFRLDTSKPDGTDTPFNTADATDNSKWDVTGGSNGGDGIPDNYFLVTDPAKLEASLDTLFRKILAKIASGTAAAVVATSSNGVGLTYQALYEQEHKDDSGRVAQWAGSLAAFWTDSAGHLREDATGNKRLDDYTVDPVIEFSYQSGGQKTIVNRYFSSDPDNYLPGAPVPVELSQLKTVWNARQWLWSPTLDVNDQRAYGSAATNTSLTSGGRYITTWIDKNFDGKVDRSEVVPFTWASFKGSYAVGNKNAELSRFLNSNDRNDNGEANKIVDWIRGSEVAGMRNRTVDYDASNPGRVLRLGDIVDSTPLAVSTPAESYDLLYNDTSYGKFRDQYRSRRQMIYVGANDGMIHAFNGGFYNTSCQRLTTQPDKAACGTADPNAAPDLDSTVTAHPLGSEVWSFIPGDLLPHLRWLTDVDYKHLFYVDGSPVAFDAKVFASDTVHPEGWGTIMVVRFRLGGGTVSVNIQRNGNGLPFVGESAYVVLDVTDPESAPTLLAELKFSGERTVSAPALVVVRDVPSGTPNKFFLALGNGPNDAKKVSSSSDLSVRIFDMANIVANDIAPVKTFDLSGASPEAGSSFAGDLIASDYDLNGLAESLYFGSVRDTGLGSDQFGGAFWKIAINGDINPDNWTASLMMSLKSGDAATTTGKFGRPVTIRPTLGLNNRGAPMVFFGTGRFFDSADKATYGPQRIYGIIDTSLLNFSDAQFGGVPLASGKLANVTGLNIYTDETVDGTGTPSSVSNFTDLKNIFDTAAYVGWYRDLQTSGTNPSERVVSSQTLLGSILLTNTYTPGTSICTGLGTSAIYGLNYKTGTSDPSLDFFGTTTSGSKQAVNPSTSLGQGLPAPPSLHLGSAKGSADKKVTACIQTSTGAIVCKDILTLNPVNSGEQSWREPVYN